ncbi:unnamed protein product [Clonostachys byssicola]|uniref:Uncharacterized protein n=1 Tax=Clonostachys byssicola TaxID=160290 RepID=A0A9N9U3U9_9HYPO|nr:unnamed protein product [Clonostachys byssicola]
MTICEASITVQTQEESTCPPQTLHVKRVKKLHDTDEDLFWKLTEAAAGQIEPNSIDLCALHVFGGQKDSLIPAPWPRLDFTTSDLNRSTMAPA